MITVVNKLSKNSTFFFALLVFGIACAIYIPMVSQYPGHGDSPEFITASYILGIPHAPGYPLYTMLGYLFTKLPWGTVAWRVNLLSAVLSAMTAALVYASIAKILRASFSKVHLFIVQGASVSSAFALAFSSTFWLNSLVAEVFALNSFFAALLIYVVLIWREKRLISEKSGRIWFYLFCFVAGLSMTHHYTIGFLLFGFLYLIFITDRDYLVNLNIILPALFFFILGVSPFLYLPWAAHRNPGLNWGNPGNLENFIRVILRLDYGNSFRRVAEAGESLGFVTQIEHYVRTVSFNSLGFLPMFALVSIGTIIVRLKQNRLTVFPLILWLFSGPLFVIFSSGQPVDTLLWRAIMERFHILSFVPLAVLAGIGLYTAGLCFVKLGFYIKPKLPVLVFIVFAAIAFYPVRAVFVHRPFVGLISTSIIGNYYDAIEHSLDEKILVVVHGDMIHFGIENLQLVQHKLKEVAYVNQVLFNRSAWYRKQIITALPTIQFPPSDPRDYFPQTIELMRINPDWPIMFVTGSKSHAENLKDMKKDLGVFQKALFFYSPSRISPETKDEVMAFNKIFFDNLRLPLNTDLLAFPNSYYPFTIWFQTIGQHYSRSFYNYALMLEEDKRYEEAAQAFHMAYVLDRSFGIAVLAEADSYFALDQLDKAEELYRTVIKNTDAVFPQAYQSLSNIYRKRGEVARADNYQKTYEEIVKSITP